jgi:CDP-glucose 4,6-dehydratase
LRGEGVINLRNAFNNKKVLITGHTGFKGTWLTLWLRSLGANVIGLSVDVPSAPSHFDVADIPKYINDNRLDIRDSKAVRQLILEVQPDFVFHLAAQALVRPSYENPLETIAINALGSANLLDALRYLTKPVVAVMITSDKAYDNVEWVWGYRETDRLGGKDPYSASKGMAELAIRTFIESYFLGADSNVRVGITRAGNVIGGGDWAVDRIVPDCMRAWMDGGVVDIRNPEATRPWQHVLEPLSGYLSLGAMLAGSGKLHGEAYNFGPPAYQNYSVRTLIDEMKIHWDHICWNDTSQSQKHLHEAGLLKLNCDKALTDLKWEPILEFKENVKMTVEWYKAYYEKQEGFMYDFSMGQIEEYSQLAKARGAKWAIE